MLAQHFHLAPQRVDGFGEHPRFVREVVVRANPGMDRQVATRHGGEDSADSVERPGDAMRCQEHMQQNRRRCHGERRPTADDECR